MECIACGSANPEGSRFCLECGAPQQETCAACGAALPAAAKFCNACGQPIAGRAAPPASAPAARDPRAYTPRHLADRILQSRSAIEGERKQVTVLFADVKGSMELAQELDAEAWHGILDGFFQILSDGVHRFDGTVNQYTGDGIMALFGAPLAHEDHAQRACYAALHLRDTLGAYAREVKREHGVGFSVRMGIHSGEVVVGKIGDDLRMDYTAQGLAVGLASRMQELASPDTCYLTGETARRVQGYFELEDLGPFRVKGVSEPVPVFELKRAGAVRTRFDVSRARGLTRFVGRDADLRTLETALAEAQAGNGQVVGLVADAGVGKSRLSFEFLEICRARGIRTLEGHAVPHGKNVPLLPILEAFRDYFGIDERDGDRQVREKIAGRMLLFDEQNRDDLPLLFEFFGVPDPEQPAPRIDPEARQRRLFGVLRRSVQRDSSAGTVVTLIEDLHWLDGASEAWLAEWVDAHAGSQNLLVVNTRPEYGAEWMRNPWYRQVPLRPLGPQAIRELLEDLLGETDSVEALAEAIHARSAGNPFFAEEIVRGLVDSGHLQGEKGSYRLVTPVERLEVPDSVRALLAARIDKLPENDKLVLQTAAVLGKEFAEPILAAVCECRSEDLAPVLQRLKAADFLYEESLYPVAEYAFKHPLTQEVALHSLLRERRRGIHEKAAKAIEAARRNSLDEAAGLIAHHFEEAGHALEAGHWHARAATYIGSSDFGEALRHWQRVRELVRQVPDAPEAPALGVDACHQVLASALRGGIDDDERERAFEEGLAWARRSSDPYQEGRLYQALSVAESTSRDGTEAALAHARQWLHVASAFPDPERSAQRHWPSLQPLFVQGELAELRERLAWQLEATRGHPEWGLRDWNISAVANANCVLGNVTALDGSLVLAGELIEEGARIGREVGDTEGEAWALAAFAGVAYLGGDLSMARAGCQRGFELAERVGAPFLRVQTHRQFAWVLLMDGRIREAAELFEGVHRMIVERGMSGNAGAVAGLSEAVRAEGDVGRAIQLAGEGLAYALERKCRIDAIYCALALARALQAAGSSPERIIAVLGQADELIARTGAVNFAPLFAVERADLAGRSGDAGERTAQLRRALDAFRANGATGHAERVERLLG